MTPRARPDRSGVPKPKEDPQKALLGLLGLAARAGSVVAGTDLVRRAVRQGAVSQVLLAADASPVQREKLVPLLAARAVGYRVVLQREQMGGALGRGPVSAVGITDAHFARRAAELAAALTSPQE